MNDPVRPRRVAIIGFDSLDPGLLEHWSDRGHLPTFKRLFADAAWSPVVNPRGFEAGTCWPSMWSGAQPDQHGIHDAFYIFDSREYCVRIAKPAEIPVEPFWIPASRGGRRSLLVDVPYTFVDPDVAGVQVCDWLVHVRSDDRRLHCSPDTLAARIESDYGLNPWFTANRCPINEQDGYTVTGLASIVNTLSSRIATKTRFCRDMLAEVPWDLFFAVFHEGHDVGHMCWHAHDPGHERHDPELFAQVGDPLLQIYKRLDEATGALLDALPRDTVVLVYTSHGIGPERTASRFLDTILERLEQGLAPEPARTRAMTERLAPLYRALVPAVVRRRLAPSRIMRRAYQRVENDRLRRRRYFAINPSYATGGVRFNVKGRDADGVVTPGPELEALMQDVGDRLLEMQNADTGEPLVEYVTATSDLYRGPMRHALPDLLVEWNMSRPIERVCSPRIGDVRNHVQSVRSGDHATSKEGLLFARSAAAVRGPQAAIHVIDLAPTILRLLGVGDDRLAGTIIPHLSMGRM
ncbi:MAG TPA: alkaline phosphatase family protein [Methylomirabilota bacterium]|nr:alkaline phosphatase family protein [Methylomirabilota bacterium]